MTPASGTCRAVDSRPRPAVDKAIFFFATAFRLPPRRAARAAARLGGRRAARALCERQGGAAPEARARQEGDRRE